MADVSGLSLVYYRQSGNYTKFKSHCRQTPSLLIGPKLDPVLKKSDCHCAKEYPDLARFATYIARSELEINESAVAPCCGKTAIPMLA